MYFHIQNLYCALEWFLQKTFYNKLFIHILSPVNMNMKSMLWNAVSKKMESLLLLLEKDINPVEVLQTIEGISLIVQLSVLCTVHCTQDVNR